MKHLTLFALFMGFALAQTDPSGSAMVDWSGYTGWFADPLLFTTAIIGITRMVRQNFTRFSLEGLWRVVLLTVGIGVTIGLIGDLMDLITLAPFSSYPKLVGGALYGAAGGLSAVLGVSVYDLLFYRAGAKLEEGREKAKASQELPPSEVKLRVDIPPSTEGMRRD